jgi:uncharacterized membrane-anchored protein YjiN (DUF445 family)
MSLPMPGADRLRALRRMKLVAASLLLFAAAVFVVAVTVGHGHGGWGYLQAAAEAAMVGGLADWFAVTALFRYPLGIPIPHTAIIPRKKDQIGESLASFVQQNFLTQTVVGERLAAAEIPRRAGEWLMTPAHATRIAGEAESVLQAASSMLRDDEIRTAIAGYADRRIRAFDAAPVVSRVLIAVCDSGQHQVALTAALRGLSRFLELNRLVFRRRLTEESPEWVPNWVDDRLFNRLFSGVQSFVNDVVADPEHDLRTQFDRFLRDYAQALRDDPVKAQALEAAKLNLLEHPEVRGWLGGLWGQLKTALLNAAADPQSELRRTLESSIVRLGTSLAGDTELQARVDGWLQGGVTHVLARYSDDIAGLISSTVARWDAADTGRRLELQVGRDLQFIRVNGTVVGSLVGVLIYTVGQLL